MAYSSEIDKLLARHRENPKGRNFAPLADAYRKAGQLDEAIKLCRQGLERHPDYISAHIVLGRCLIDKKDDAGAEGAFRQVLSLDPENVIALKVLADVATRNDRPGDAIEWLTRLLSADPMNGDAAEALAQARGRAAAAAAATALMTAAPDSGPDASAPEDAAAAAPLVEKDEAVELHAAAPDESLVEPEPALPGQDAGAPPPPPLEIETFAMADAPTTALSQPDFEVERASTAAGPLLEVPPEAPGVEEEKVEEAEAPEPPPAAGPATEAEEPPAETGVETFETAAAAAGATVPLAGLEVDETEEILPPVDVAPLDGLARTQYEGSGMFRVEAQAAADEVADAPPSAPEESAPAAAAEPVDLPLILPDEAEAEAQVRRSAAAQSPAPAASSAEPPALPLLSDDDGAADQAALSSAEPVLTETMAELYLRQGHAEDALRVYRALQAQHPDDARLAAKVAELGGPPSRARVGQSATTFLRSLFRGEAVPAVPQDVEPAAAPVADPGTVLDDAFDAGTEAEEAAAAAAAGSGVGQPTQPAREPFSLDAVFGEGARESEAVPAPAEEPAQAAPRPSGFSFDEFFSGGEPASAPEPEPSTPPARSSGRTTRGQEPEEDLDQFQSWLRGLKT